MSMELETLSESLELEEESEEERFDWQLKRIEDLVPSDFTMYDDDPKPFMIATASFEYMNKAWIEAEKKIQIANADYRERYHSLNRFDATEESRAGVVPLPIDDDRRLRLTPLCKFALKKYNAENQNQGANFVFTDIVKTTWRPGGMYYVTFHAQDHSNTHATTFQAQVRRLLDGEPRVLSCAIKT